MKGISFIPSSDDDKRSKRKSLRGDIEYSTGEVPAVEAPKRKPAKKKPVKKQPKQKPTKQTKQPKQVRQQPKSDSKKKESSFAIWRKKRAVAKEQAGQEKDAKKRKKELEERKEDAVKKIKKSQKESKSASEAEGLHKAPQHHKEEAGTDLLVAATKPVTDAEHDAPKHHKEQVGADLLEASTKKADIGLHPAQEIPEDEAPDLTSPRGGKVTAEDKKVADKKKQKKKDKGKKLKKDKDGAKDKKEEERFKLDLNLIPSSVKDEQKIYDKAKDLGYVAIGMVVLVGVVFGVMKWYEQQINVDIADTQNQVISVDQEINSYAELKSEAEETNDRLLGISEVLQTHVYWTPFLDTLEDLTLPTVYYESMSGSALTGEFAFQVIATDYSQVNPQVELFLQSPHVKDVNVTSASKVSAGGIVPAADEGEEIVPTTAATDVSGEEEVTAEQLANDALAKFLAEQTGEGDGSEPASELSFVSFSLSVDFDPAIFSTKRTKLD